MVAFRAFSVFSAQAEVFPAVCSGRLFVRGFLRASGGVSIIMASFRALPRFSPRKRRCFHEAYVDTFRRAVFSAQAEVFPRRCTATLGCPGFLRASGGVSDTISVRQ